MPLPLLAIDTSGARLQLGLVTPDGVLTEIEARERGHAEILFDRVASLLARAGLDYADLSRVAVVTGPGSFSGLRIGLSAARGLGLALSIPVIGVPRLLALSLSAIGPGPVGVLVDARRGEAWCQRFAVPGQSGGDPELRAMADARASLGDCVELIRTDFADIAAVARFAGSADPQAYPPVPAYIRDADAKPQIGARVARVEDAPC